MGRCAATSLKVPSGDAKAHKQAQQCAARERWFAKPGVQDEQREKARIRVAKYVRSVMGAYQNLTKLTMIRRKQEELMASQSPTIPTTESSTTTLLHDGSGDYTQEACGDESDEGNGPSPSFLYASEEFAPPSLEELHIRVVDWQTEWGKESEWGRAFNDTLQKARQGGWRDTDHFFAQCEVHVRRGKELIVQLKHVARRPPKGTRDRLTDIYLQIYNLLQSLIAETKFFEVRLDDFAPAVPYSRLSEIRYYHRV
ncbi:hypothetical protein HYDPIDRAFT_33465 [Hydnomerulius pinastri MD-312]|uniref:Uncharacterized protein n=1 Tax=Hydnomerulius pinastri MD-312 TaxID=994086 RepID=A0A0C9W076_9AGAM|nr:hypothetical protein HYDPIDRAFT_33465 [Hydnomerulius pinastri MD-312]